MTNPTNATTSIPFTPEESLELLESAYFALTRERDRLGHYLDLEDTYLSKLQNKLEDYLQTT